MTHNRNDSGPDASPGVSDQHLASVVPSERGGREVRVGVFVLVGLLSFIAVLFLMTDPATLRGRYMVVTVMEDAGGIRRGDPIQMRGVNIGRVSKFEMTGAGRVAVTMEIEGEWGIPVGSRARLGDSGLFGGRTLLVEPSGGSRMHAEWDTIPGQGERESIFETAEGLGEDAEAIFASIQSLLDDSTVASLKVSATELPTLLSTLRGAVEAQRNELSRLTSSLSRSAENLEVASEASPELASAVARADSLLNELEGMTGTLNSAMTSLDGILARIDAGEGTLGRLSRDDSLYVTLTNAVDAVGQLATAIRERPGDFLTIEIF